MAVLYNKENLLLGTLRLAPCRDILLAHLTSLRDLSSLYRFINSHKRSLVENDWRAIARDVRKRYLRCYGAARTMHDCHLEMCGLDKRRETIKCHYCGDPDHSIHHYSMHIKSLTPSFPASNTCPRCFRKSPYEYRI